MQTRELWNRCKWKVVAGAAAVTALGIGGLARVDLSGLEGPGRRVGHRCSSSTYVRVLRPTLASRPTL